jgi:hypothetical protein
MVLTTLVASTTYAWVEGFAIETPRYEATQIWWILGHFSTYSLAMVILFACITGGFALIKGRSMFVKGKRYFLFTFSGNFPFSWMVEDFAFFWFYPDARYRLSEGVWSNWFLGGVWLQDPWRSAVKIWIPTWYGLVLVFWLAMMLYAHRCTVYDNLVKDEIAREIVPRKVEIPRIEVKKPVRVPEEVVEGRRAPAETKAEPPTIEAEKAKPQPRPREVPQAPTSTPKPEQPPAQRPALEKRGRSPEAEEALKKLRAKWLRNHASGTSDAS